MIKKYVICVNLKCLRVPDLRMPPLRHKARGTFCIINACSADLFDLSGDLIITWPEASYSPAGDFLAC